MKDSKTYAVGNDHFKDKNIDKDFIGNLELVKHDLEKTLRELSRLADKNPDRSMYTRVRVGKNRYVELKRSEGEKKFHLSVKQDGKNVQAKRSDLVKLCEQRETLLYRAENYKSPEQKREQAKQAERAATSFLSKSLSERLKTAREDSQKDNAAREQNTVKEGKNRYDR